MFFDIDAHRHCFATNPDEAFFWHGQTDGVGGQNNAMEIASENGGKTLEMCMLENREELEDAGVRFRDNSDGTVSIGYGSNEEENNHFWDSCSKSFAEQASGDIHVIDGSDIRPNGQTEAEYPCVYNTLEHPTLESNQNVDSISHIDPNSREIKEVETLNHNNGYDEDGTKYRTPMQEEGQKADEIANENNQNSTSRDSPTMSQVAGENNLPETTPSVDNSLGESNSVTQ